MSDLVFRVGDEASERALLRKGEDFGLVSLDLARPPARLWGDVRDAPAVALVDMDARRARSMPTPAALLKSLPDGETWQGMTKRSLLRAQGWFLIAEDPQRRLEAKEVATLAHQASLVKHVLDTPELSRVLIADEVGLGKTVEAGLIIQQLLAQRPGLRVLYLAPARLVRNVRREFRRLGLSFRMWVAGPDRDATLEDDRILASIHRAAIPNHAESFNHVRPFDVIVVDECHHLSDWARFGGSPVRRYKLVEQLQGRLAPGGRLILMSGTPHQGHAARFENILRLLRTDGESDEAIRGRVIYRTKDDITDWNNDPLFPLRRVNPPIVIDLGPEHRAWLQDIHEFFVPPRVEGQSDNRIRAAGWRCSQGLQWATSSLQAGLGYLARQAIRAGWTPADEELAAALAAIRPYRGGNADEPVAALFARVDREIGRQVESNDVDDIEELDDENAWKPDPDKLANLLRDGVALIENDPDAKWRHLEEKVLADVGDEKVVLFAQPIETVTALCGYLERRTSKRPALIIGDQSEDERSQQIEAFWRSDGPQFLVSSRAGGEGINLQVAWRLVHLDVPWNPMDLEQRVGRVHRFLSKRTVVVDTLVVQDSREVDTYRVARDKLHEISATMVPPDRFEALYARVMSLVPPEELSDIMSDRPIGQLTDGERARLSSLVTDGFKQWQSFHSRYSSAQKKMLALEPGLATWNDLADFLVRTADAKPASGFDVLQFRWQDGEVVEDSRDAIALEIDERYYACGDYAGMPVTRGDGEKARPIGTNVAPVSDLIRNVAFPGVAVGAAHVRFRGEIPVWIAELPKPFGVIVLACAMVRAEAGVWTENGMGLETFIVRLDRTERMTPEQRGDLLRAVFAGQIRREPEAAPALAEQIAAEELKLIQALRQPSDVERSAGIRHAVFPILGAIVGS